LKRSRLRRGHGGAPRQHDDTTARRHDVDAAGLTARRREEHKGLKEHKENLQLSSTDFRPLATPRFARWQE